MQTPIAAYLIISISDITITTYGISLGYHEGNPVLQWVDNQWLVPVFLLAEMVAAVVVLSRLYTEAPEHMAPALSIAVYSACVYRLIFGTLSWSWLFTGYQPWWIVGGV